MTARANLLPELWPLHRVAKELGKASHVLVTASRNGTFPPVFRVGALWFVKADDVRAWFSRNHAEAPATADIERVRQAGRAVAARQPRRRPAQPRADTGA